MGDRLEARSLGAQREQPSLLGALHGRGLRARPQHRPANGHEAVFATAEARCCPVRVRARSESEQASRAFRKAPPKGGHRRGLGGLCVSVTCSTSTQITVMREAQEIKGLHRIKHVPPDAQPRTDDGEAPASQHRRTDSEISPSIINVVGHATNCIPSRRPVLVRNLYYSMPQCRLGVGGLQLHASVWPPGMLA